MNKAICHIVNHFILWELGHYFEWGHYSREDSINILIFLWGFNSRGDSIRVRIVYKNLRYIILNQNFKIVVLGAGCTQLFFSEFWAKNGTKNIKSDFNGGLWNAIFLKNDFFYVFFIGPITVLTVLDWLPSITNWRHIPCEIYSH